ncbi:uncharacterized protein G2W53_033244 [Senna tora]|uniref:Uncharacterized protein n=1 Tax=Senna tora TaxID=362788 RepID=A0A834W8A8_9FABA|nr:uncharacterized protein G2W53_033244 [Senna tora]
MDLVASLPRCCLRCASCRLRCAKLSSSVSARFFLLSSPLVAGMFSDPLWFRFFDVFHVFMASVLESSINVFHVFDSSVRAIKVRCDISMNSKYVTPRLDISSVAHWNLHSFQIH